MPSLTHLDVEKDWLQPKVIDGIGGSDEQLLVDVEAVEYVDGAHVLGLVIALKLIDSLRERRSRNKVLEVGVVLQGIYQSTSNMKLPYNEMGWEAIERLCFLASLPLAGTGQKERGKKTQPFNRFQSRLGILHVIHHSMVQIIRNPVQIRIQQTRPMNPSQAALRPKGNFTFDFLLYVV